MYGWQTESSSSASVRPADPCPEIQKFGGAKTGFLPFSHGYSDTDSHARPRVNRLFYRSVFISLQREIVAGGTGAHSTCGGVTAAAKAPGNPVGNGSRKRRRRTLLYSYDPSTPVPFSGGPRRETFRQEPALWYYRKRSLVRLVVYPLDRRLQRPRVSTGNM